MDEFFYSIHVTLIHRKRQSIFSNRKLIEHCEPNLHKKKCPQHHYLKDVHQKLYVQDVMTHHRLSRRHQLQRQHRVIRFRLWIEWRRNVHPSNGPNRQIDVLEHPIMSSAAATQIKVTRTKIVCKMQKKRRIATVPRICKSLKRPNILILYLISCNRNSRRSRKWGEKYFVIAGLLWNAWMFWWDKFIGYKRKNISRNWSVNIVSFNYKLKRNARAPNLNTINWFWNNIILMNRWKLR